MSVDVDDNIVVADGRPPPRHDDDCDNNKLLLVEEGKMKDDDDGDRDRDDDVKDRRNAIFLETEPTVPDPTNSLRIILLAFVVLMLGVWLWLRRG